MNPVESIKYGLNQKDPFKLIARKIFLSYPTFVFKDKEEVEFDIKDRTSNFFNIPLTSVQISGSSKTGYSPYKEREFIPGKSDLDVAIINAYLFTRYSEISHNLTRGYSDFSKFSVDRRTGNNNIDYFLSNLNNGFFRPDLMPNCRMKIEWFNFYNKLSNDYYELFKSINAGIYISEYYFESKQTDCIQRFNTIKDKL